MQGPCHSPRSLLDALAAPRLPPHTTSPKTRRPADSASQIETPHYDFSRHRSLRSAARPRLTLVRSEEHTSELQSLMRISYAVFCLTTNQTDNHHSYTEHLKQPPKKT